MNFEKIGETNCRIDDIQNQDKILIGGSFYGKMDLAVTADLEQFEDFFQKVEINAQKVQENEAMKNWINQVAPNLDSNLFAHMWAFDNTLRKMYPNLSTNIDKRQKYYDEEGTKKLSQSVSDGVCMCAEISILAQAYFQKQNIPTKISGGELSRLMLALKVVSSSVDDTPTVIFDEIDTGISGKIGAEIAKKLARLALKHQLLCVTHLPQIASMADTHYFIDKYTEGGQTFTRLTLLDENASIEEVSRLSGAKDISTEAFKNAAQMKKWSDNYKLSLKNEANSD